MSVKILLYTIDNTHVEHLPECTLMGGYMGLDFGKLVVVGTGKNLKGTHGNLWNLETRAVVKANGEMQKTRTYH